MGIFVDIQLWIELDRFMDGYFDFWKHVLHLAGVISGLLMQIKLKETEMRGSVQKCIDMRMDTLNPSEVFVKFLGKEFQSKQATSVLYSTLRE